MTKELRSQLMKKMWKKIKKAEKAEKVIKPIKPKITRHKITEN